MKRSFVDEIRTELDEQELDQYHDLMRGIKQNRITKAEAFAGLDELFKGHDNLVVGLNNFLNTYCPVPLSDDDGDVDDDDNDDHSNSNKDGDSNSDTILGKHPDLMGEFEVFLSGRFLKKRPERDNDEEAVLEDRPEIRITPSYVLRKNNNGGDYQEQQDALNDVCVSEPPGIADFSNRAEYIGDEYEHIVEDQRFHIDLLLEYLKSTAGIVQKYIDIANGDDGPIEKKDYLKARNLRCIEYLYGDYGLEVIGILKWKPKIVLPVLLNRLNQKQEELIKFHSDLLETDDDRVRRFMRGYRSREVDAVDRQLQVAERY